MLQRFPSATDVFIDPFQIFSDEYEIELDFKGEKKVIFFPGLVSSKGIKGITLHSYRLMKDATISQIIEELGGKKFVREKLCISLPHISAFTEGSLQHLLGGGLNNLFFSCDVAGDLYVVQVFWDSKEFRWSKPEALSTQDCWAWRSGRAIRLPCS